MQQSPDAFAEGVGALQPPGFLALPEQEQKSCQEAEAFFSRLRRYYLGISHKCEPKYLADIAWEMAWREDVRRKTEGTKLAHLLKTIWANGLSMKWRGYWQKRKPQASPSSSSST